MEQVVLLSKLTEMQKKTQTKKTLKTPKTE